MLSDLAMIAELAALLHDRDGESFCIELLKQGLPAGPVRPIDVAMAAEHTAAREMVTELDGYRGLGTPIKLSRTPGGTRRKPPRYGQDSDEVLTQHGFSTADIATLKAGGVLYTSRRR